MTKKERDEKIYYWIDELDLTTLEPTGFKYRILKSGIIWQNYLLPEEQKKFEGLSDIDNLIVCMSCDPINTLNALNKKK